MRVWIFEVLAGSKGNLLVVSGKSPLRTGVGCLYEWLFRRDLCSLMKNSTLFHVGRTFLGVVIVRPDSLVGRYREVALHTLLV